MQNGRRLLRWVAPMALAVILCTSAVPAGAAKADTKNADKYSRPDVILIDAAGRQKTLEMAPAVFLHDAHTAALAKQGKDCTVCHTAMDSNAPFAFMGIAADASASELEKQFHNGCITCHNELGVGPRDGECRTCHDSATPYVNNAKPLEMSQSLHYQHIASKSIFYPADAAPGQYDPQNCGACHHVFDKKLDKLVWEKGKEEACSVCHGAAPEGNTPSLRTASHEQCVKCHALMDMKANAGKGSVPAESKLPLTCASCHTVQGQAAIPVMKDVPRLMRGQPDAIMLLPVSNTTPEGSEVQAAMPNAGLQPVLFNHKAHEAVAQCSVCHHTGLNDGGCTQCHTVQGKAEGNFIQLAQAMHDPNSERSCVGCHQQRLLENKDCAGCHIFVEPMQATSCATCHAKVEHLPDATKGAPLVVSKEERQAIAARDIAARKPVAPLPATEIPEFVIIDTLADEYEPVKLPHRKIYEALQRGMAGNKLAGLFHYSPEATCAACHHNSPVEDLKNPPKCSSCHGSQADKFMVEDNRPSLKAAFHQLCIACHERMDVKPVAQDCAGCHAPRANSADTAKAGR